MEKMFSIKVKADTYSTLMTIKSISLLKSVDEVIQALIERYIGSER